MKQLDDEIVTGNVIALLDKKLIVIACSWFIWFILYVTT